MADINTSSDFTLSFSKKEAERLLRFLEAEKELLIADYKQALNTVNARIDEVKFIVNGRYQKTHSEISELTIARNDGYNPEWTWDAKIDYFLNDGNLYTSSELVKMVISKEPNLNRQTAMKSMSSRLSVRAKNGNIYTEKNEAGDNVYGIFKGPKSYL